MKVGAHVSIAGGIFNAPSNAAAEGCECFQMFTRSPRGGPVQALDKTIIGQFKDNCKKYNIASAYIHAPYYINFASAKSRIRHGSATVIREELERGSALGVKALMTHLGSAKDVGPNQAVQMVIKGLQTALSGYSGSTQFLLENAAGAGQIIGAPFEDLATIIKGLGKYDVGICLDTCHAFATGYDLRSKAAVDRTLKLFDKVIGLSKLKLIHANDSQGEIKSNKDRHEHIGYGKIGKEGFKALINHPRLKNVDFILETPMDGKRVNDINKLRGFRKK